MAYDENLAGRVRQVMSAGESVNEREMFGGLAFMVRGNMCCGIIGDSLMLRLSPEQGESALAQPHVRPMDFTGRPMKGFVLVDPPALSSDEQLRRWVHMAEDFVSTLPAK